MMSTQHEVSRSSRPSSVQKAVKPADGQDRAWESELLSLLCSLETLRTRLQEQCEAGRAVLALDTMTAMVKGLSAFVAVRLPHVSEESTSAWAESVRDLHQRIALFQSDSVRMRNRLHKSTWEYLRRLFGGAGDQGDPRQQFVAVTQDLYEVLTVAFELLMRLFHSPTAARDWNEARQAFLADLRGLVESLEP